ncbi:MAG: hypothetical protein DYH14_04720 [Betaproteobacteria bacterium PRO3]|nr:hypothetical protein [Betaproteobacteria bacterium PRO3]
MTAARRLPAFAGDLADARRRGFTLRNPTVSVGLGWRRPTIGFGVAIPPHEEPAALEWGWARGLDVILWHRGEPAARVRAAVRAIRAARPRRLVIVSVGNPEDGRGRIINIIRPER